MFSYYFCLMIEGSGSGSLTKGARSGRPKTYGSILRIRNTALEAITEPWRAVNALNGSLEAQNGALDCL
jgi:hypothetical protein